MAGLLGFFQSKRRRVRASMQHHRESPKTRRGRNRHNRREMDRFFGWKAKGRYGKYPRVGNPFSENQGDPFVAEWLRKMRGR